MYEPPALISPARVILMAAHKQSIKERWEDHFVLQLRSHGFSVLRAGSVGPYTNLTVVFRQFRFHPKRKWTLDFAIPAIKLGIEIEGGIWRPGGGAHSRPANIQRDIEKGNALTMTGWRLLRFSPAEIKSGESIRMTTELALPQGI